MTLLEAINEMHTLFPGVYVNVEVSVGWHCYEGGQESGPQASVACYAEGIGHIVWQAPSIDIAMQMVRAKHGLPAAGTAELAISDADLPVVTP